MKNVALYVVVLFTSFMVNAQNKNGVTLTVTIENVLNDDGTLLASLHTNETFMKNEGLLRLKEKAKKGETVLIFENVTPGNYAVMILHDANDNMRMDYHTNGMPKENYGMSNNPMLMGPPTFNDAKFEVTDKDMELSIRF